MRSKHVYDYYLQNVHSYIQVHQFVFFFNRMLSVAVILFISIPPIHISGIIQSCVRHFSYSLTELALHRQTSRRAIELTINSIMLMPISNCIGDQYIELILCVCVCGCRKFDRIRSVEGTPALNNRRIVCYIRSIASIKALLHYIFLLHREISFKK